MASHYPIVSDDPMYEVLTHVPLQEASGAAALHHGLLLATAVFTSAVPIDIESVDIKELIRFREEFKDERRALYDWIATFRSDLGKLSDPKQLEEAVAHHRATVERRMDALKKKFGVLNLKTVHRHLFVFDAGVGLRNCEGEPSRAVRRWGAGVGGHCS